MLAPSSPGRVGPYIVERELGRGTHGIVYLARRPGNPAVQVALKVVEKQGRGDRFLLEPALLSRLNHPCIVGLRDYFQVKDQLVLVLEYLQGENLQAKLDQGAAFSQEEVRDLLMQLASALAHAHAQGIIHRDLKPSNIHLVRDGDRTRVVLTDFGIGRVAEGLQQEKHTGGTYLYMAPEQLRGRPCAQSDLWALGIVAYRLLTGQMPFPGPTLAELSRQVLFGSPRPLGSLRAEPLEPQLETAVNRLLDKSLQERFSSAEELLQGMGFRGDPERVIGGTSAPPSRARVQKTLDRQFDRGIAWRRVFLLLALTLYLLSGGLLSGTVLLASMGLFLYAQGRTRRVVGTALTLAALGLMAGHIAMRYYFPAWDNAGVRLLLLALTKLMPSPRYFQKWAIPVPDLVWKLVIYLLIGVLFLVILFLQAIVGTVYVSLRRVQRQKVLRQSVLAGDCNPDGYLDILRAALDTRVKDVDFHLKYAEALFNFGRVKEAAVEARLLLCQDPYHFGGNLLLAHAYHQLGLFADSLKVCEDYLAFNGYCFEFSEMRDECRLRLRMP